MIEDDLLRECVFLYLLWLKKKGIKELKQR